MEKLHEAAVGEGVAQRPLHFAPLFFRRFNGVAVKADDVRNVSPPGRRPHRQPEIAVAVCVQQIVF
ncbi:hypothetical protein SDC9_137817 [bioreactor metagenome]|uniref:Uncharacterized protein n=1 Tax=bioreactor metagenome TaxID=1076179 RepID=A0A645DN77_9ZZZZ